MIASVENRYKAKAALFALLIASGLFIHACARGQTESVETFLLPSGDLLENHYTEDGDVFHSDVDIKRSSTGTREKIGQMECVHRGITHGTLFKTFPPQLVHFGKHPALIIGPFFCENIKNQSFNTNWVVQSFLFAAGRDAEEFSAAFSILGQDTIYTIVNVDSRSNTIVTEKIDPLPNSLPQFLVYSSPKLGDWRLDFGKTMQMNSMTNGVLPFDLKLEYSIIAYESDPDVPPGEERASALARPKGKEVFNGVLDFGKGLEQKVDCVYTNLTGEVERKTIIASYRLNNLATNKFYVEWRDPDGWDFQKSFLLPLNVWTQTGYSQHDRKFSEGYIRLQRGP